MDNSNAHLTGLLTGNEEFDAKLQAAFALGLRQGRVIDRTNLQRAAQIEATRHLLAALMRAQQMDLQAAMITLAIPRKDRKTYEKIFAEKARQKERQRL